MQSFKQESSIMRFNFSEYTSGYGEDGYIRKNGDQMEIVEWVKCEWGSEQGSCGGDKMERLDFKGNSASEATGVCLKGKEERLETGET